MSDTAPQSVQENDNVEKTVDVCSVGLADVGTVLLRSTVVRVINHLSLCRGMITWKRPLTFAASG